MSSTTQGSAPRSRLLLGLERNSSIVVGRDALNNVFVTGDGNAITVVIADPRLQRSTASAHANPYRGLLAFHEADSEMFFGRDDLKVKLRLKLHALLHDHAKPARLLPILGPSGTGKSSLVRAGLLPELVRNPIDGLHNPDVLVLRPGADPLRELANVLARCAATNGAATDDLRRISDDFVHRAATRMSREGHRLVIFVDQLEELFTECMSESARSMFLTTLTHAALHPDRMVSVIFSMRNDFAGSLSAPAAFATAVRDPIRVSQMSKTHLIEAIAQPAKVLGHPWPAALVENLVLQCEGRIGALPLLQYALQYLWPEHVAGRLMERQWSSHLIEDFVIDRANALHDGSGIATERTANQRIIRRAFVSMVQLGEGAADTRRVARLSEFVARGETITQVRDVLAPFASSEARLIMVSEVGGESTYELAHEALIGSWDRLRVWLGHVASPSEAEALRAELRLRRRLRYAAEAWRDAPEALMQPPELQRVKELCERIPEELTTAEHEFIDASIDALEAHRRWRRRVRLVAIGASIVFVVVVSILGLVAWRERLEALQQRSSAEQAELTMQKAVEDAKAVADRVNKLTADLGDLDDRMKAAEIVASNAKSMAENAAAVATLERLRRQKFDMERRIEAAKSAAAKAERAGSDRSLQ